MVLLQKLSTEISVVQVCHWKKNNCGIASSSGKCFIEIFLCAGIIGVFYLMRKVGQNNVCKVSGERESTFVCSRFMLLLLVSK